MRRRGFGRGAERRGGRGSGKEPELPDLNKVNFPAIWSVFRMEGKASKAAAASMRRLPFRLLYMQNFSFLLQNPHRDCKKSLGML